MHREKNLMEDQERFDLVEARDLHDKFVTHIASEPDGALRYLRLLSAKVRELYEEHSAVYEQAKEYFERCLRELPCISPILPEIIQGLIEQREERWFKERCVDLDERIVNALLACL